jgi:hypothetical protein
MVFVIPAFGNTEVDTFPDAPTFLQRPCVTYMHGHILDGCFGYCLDSWLLFVGWSLIAIVLYFCLLAIPIIELLICVQLIVMCDISETIFQEKKVLRRKSDDVGWEYGCLVDASNKNRVKCMLCKHVHNGGICGSC